MLLGMGFASREPVSANGSKISPRDYISGMALKGLAKASGRPKDTELLRVVAEGESEGVPTTVTLDCVIRSAHGLSAGAMGVGFPASIAAQLLERAPRGAFGPEGALPVEAFFRELRRRRIFRFEQNVRKPVLSN